MKLGIIKKDKSKVEIEGLLISIYDAGSQVGIYYEDDEKNQHGSETFIEKKDIQLIYFGGWK